MQKTITITGKRYTGRQLIQKMKFDPMSYTYWIGEVYVVPRATASDVDMRPGPLCDPAEAAYVEVCDLENGKSKMVKIKE